MNTQLVVVAVIMSMVLVAQGLNNGVGYVFDVDFPLRICFVPLCHVTIKYCYDRCGSCSQINCIDRNSY